MQSTKRKLLPNTALPPMTATLTFNAKKFQQLKAQTRQYHALNAPNRINQPHPPLKGFWHSDVAQILEVPRLSPAQDTPPPNHSTPTSTPADYLRELSETYWYPLTYHEVFPTVGISSAPFWDNLPGEPLEYFRYFQMYMHSTDRSLFTLSSSLDARNPIGQTPQAFIDTQIGADDADEYLNTHRTPLESDLNGYAPTPNKTDLELGHLTNANPYGEAEEMDAPPTDIESGEYINHLDTTPLLRALDNIDYSNLHLLKALHTLYYWDVRAIAYDEYLNHIRERGRENMRKQLENNHFKLGSTLLTRCEEYLTEHFSGLKGNEVAQLLKLATSMQRSSIGLSASGDSAGGKVEVNVHNTTNTLNAQINQPPLEESSAELINQALSDPETTRLAQDLAIKMSQIKPEQLETPIQDRSIETPDGTRTLTVEGEIIEK